MPVSLRVVVISLAGSARRAEVKRRLDAAVDVPWSFFDACTGPGARPYDPERSIRRRGRHLTPSEVGCAASHLAVIEAAGRNLDYDWTLVLEDDVVLDPKFDFRGAARMCDDLGLDYLRLYARLLAPLHTLAWIDQRQLIRFRRSPMGSQAYLISRKGAALAAARTPRIEHPVDWEMDRFWHNGLANYALYPFPVIEFVGSSSVSKFPNGPRPNAYQLAYRGVYRSFEYIRRLGANLALMIRDAGLKRRIATLNWALWPR
jgi:GR25 family glycosyltransferase involved in LPS biosynthesis